MKIQTKSGIAILLLLANLFSTPVFADDSSDIIIADSTSEEVAPMGSDEEVSAEDEGQTYVPPAPAATTDSEEYSLEGEPSDSE